MNDIIVSFESATAASKARALLSKNNIKGNIVKSADKNCGFCIRIPSNKRTRALGILHSGSVGYKVK